MLFLSTISNVIEFGRGKDKKKRKRRGLLMGGLIGSSLGAGIGYATKQDKHRLAAEQGYKSLIRYRKTKISDLDTPRYNFTNDPDNYNRLKDKYNEELQDDIKNKNILIKRRTLQSRLEELDDSPTKWKKH
jgi:hypothetical protein